MRPPTRRPASRDRHSPRKVSSRARPIRRWRPAGRDRVSTPVWPPSTDQATDACPALLSATSEVPIGLYLLDPLPEARKTGAEKPPVTVPERAQRLLRPPLKVMTAPPLELTARLRLCAGPSVPSTDSVVAGPQLLLPAGRTASVASPGFTTQPAMTLPEPSTPSTGPPVDRSRFVLRVAGAPQLPPAGCTAASSTALQVEQARFPHSATACPAGVTATTMRCPELGALPPWPRSAACQVCPFGLVYTWTCVVPPAPAALVKARTRPEPPAPSGRPARSIF